MEAAAAEAAAAQAQAEAEQEAARAAAAAAKEAAAQARRDERERAAAQAEVERTQREFERASGRDRAAVALVHADAYQAGTDDPLADLLGPGIGGAIAKEVVRGIFSTLRRRR